MQARELLDQHVFEEHCSGNEDKAAQKLCFIAFLPDILDSKAAGRRKYIEVGCVHSARQMFDVQALPNNSDFFAEVTALVAEKACPEGRVPLVMKEEREFACRF